MAYPPQDMAYPPQYPTGQPPPNVAYTQPPGYGPPMYPQPNIAQHPSPQPGYAQQPYPQQSYPQQPYPHQQPQTIIIQQPATQVVETRGKKNKSSDKSGCLAGLCAGLACCCVLDMCTDMDCDDFGDCDFD